MGRPVGDEDSLRSLETSLGMGRFVASEDSWRSLETTTPSVRAHVLSRDVAGGADEGHRSQGKAFSLQCLCPFALTHLCERIASAWLSVVRQCNNNATDTANLAAFLSAEHLGNYLASIEAAQESGAKICAHSVLRSTLTSRYPVCARDLESRPRSQRHASTHAHTHWQT